MRRACSKRWSSHRTPNSPRILTTAGCCQPRFGRGRRCRRGDRIALVLGIDTGGTASNLERATKTRRRDAAPRRALQGIAENHTLAKMWDYHRCGRSASFPSLLRVRRKPPRRVLGKFSKQPRATASTSTISKRPIGLLFQILCAQYDSPQRCYNKEYLISLEQGARVLQDSSYDWTLFGMARWAH